MRREARLAHLRRNPPSCADWRGVHGDCDCAGAAGDVVVQVSALSRLLAKVSKNPETGCWMWNGCIHRLGYGAFRLNGKIIGAHQAAYALMVGDVPNGHELDHKCRNRSCCNPDHLEPVTHEENMARGLNATKTHCKWGHEFTSGNIIMSRTGSRNCRECARRRNREYRARAGK